MDQTTQKKLDHLDQKLASLLRDLEKYSEEELQKSPQPGAWSVIQVLSHLMLSEKLSQAYVKKKLSYNPKLPSVNWQSRMRSFLLDTYVRSPLKARAPKNVNESQFPENLTIAQISADWKNDRASLRTYLSSLESGLFKKQVYKHPFGGRLSLAAMISFFDSHFDLHHKQIQRTLKRV